MSLGGEAAIPADLAALQNSAANDFVAAVSAATDGAPAAAPAPDAAPSSGTPDVPPQAAPQTTEPAGAPRSTPEAAASPQTSNIDVSSWSPEAKRALQMEGWDGKSAVSPEVLARVSSRYLEFNNRLGSKGDGAPSTTPPQAAQPDTAATPATEPQAAPKPPAPAAPPPEPTHEQIEAQVVAAEDADPECSAMVAEFQQHESRLAELGTDTTGKIGELSQAIAERRSWLNLPDIKENPLRSDEIKSEMASLVAEKNLLLAEQSRRQLDVTRLELRYDQRQGRIAQSVVGTIKERAAITRRATELATQWPTMVERVAVNAQLPKELHPRFFESAKREFVLAQRAGEVIPDLEAFLVGVAKDRLADYEAFHRLKSAEYGALATKRTETVTPPTSSVPGAPGAAPTKGDGPTSLTDLYANTERELASSFGGRLR